MDDDCGPKLSKLTFANIVKTLGNPYFHGFSYKSKGCPVYFPKCAIVKIDGTSVLLSNGETLCFSLLTCHYSEGPCVTPNCCVTPVAI